MGRTDDTHLATTPNVNLTTYKRDGTAVTTPVWIVARGEGFCIVSAAKTGKVKRARATGRVRLRPCDGMGRREFGDAYEGQARVVTDPAVVQDVGERIKTKYGRVFVAIIRVIYWLRGNRGDDVVLELDLHKAG